MGGCNEAMKEKGGVQFEVNYNEARITNNSGAIITVTWIQGTGINDFSTSNKCAPVVPGTSVSVPSDAKVCTERLEYKVVVTSALSGEPIVTWVLSGKMCGSSNVVGGILTLGLSAIIPSQGYIWIDEV